MFHKTHQPFNFKANGQHSTSIGDPGISTSLDAQRAGSVAEGLQAARGALQAALLPRGAAAGGGRVPGLRAGRARLRDQPQRDGGPGGEHQAAAGRLHLAAGRSGVHAAVH